MLIVHEMEFVILNENDDKYKIVTYDYFKTTVLKYINYKFYTCQSKNTKLNLTIKFYLIVYLIQKIFSLSFIVSKTIK
jgi:hypothetical protein